jgi:hypothetical protein
MVSRSASFRRSQARISSILPSTHSSATKELKEVGWAKGRELGKLARRDRQHFDCATLLHRACQMPKEDFKKAAEKELARKETEPWEIIYFKFYQGRCRSLRKQSKRRP